jgi:hypothetical protein
MPTLKSQCYEQAKFSLPIFVLMFETLISTEIHEVVKKVTFSPYQIGKTKTSIKLN